MIVSTSIKYLSRMATRCTPFGARQQENTSHPWGNFQALLHRKVMNALFAKQSEITLTDDDVKGMAARWDDLPHTIAAMCEVFSYDPTGATKIYLHPMGGSGAANLLGRFCHVDEKICQSVMEIMQEEEKSLPDDKLYAEIVHLPESRIGNILARPVLRPYEVPYLAKAGVGKEFQLEITDLMVSVRQRKFVLRSKRLNKEIIPRLTSAHNFSQPSVMPIYQFLCNLQNQYYRGGMGLFLSSLFNEFPYLPRITYKNVILSLARWHVKADDLKQRGEIQSHSSYIGSKIKNANTNRRSDQTTRRERRKAQQSIIQLHPHDDEPLVPQQTTHARSRGV